MSQPTHPGFIEYFEEDRPVDRLPIAQVPKELQFAQTPEGLLPVVKVVAHIRGDERIIREYAPGEKLVRSTVQRRA